MSFDDRTFTDRDRNFGSFTKTSDTMKRKKMFFSLESFLQSSCLFILPQRRYKKQRNSRINGLRSMAVAVLSGSCFRCSHAHDNPQQRLLWVLTCSSQSSTQGKCNIIFTEVNNINIIKYRLKSKV